MTKIHTFFGNKDTGIDRVKGTGLFPARDYPALFTTTETKPDYILFLDQVHSADVVIFNDLQNLPALMADAAITSLPSIALAIKTADCAPVLLYDEKTNIVAAVHSGWQGTLKNIIAPTIAAMVLQGADTKYIKAIIGPCLQRNNLAMGQDVYDQFMGVSSDNQQFFSDHPHEAHKHLFDNVAMIMAQLQSAGITAIEADPTCTLDKSTHYYSYRYRQHDTTHETMRNISLIWGED